MIQFLILAQSCDCEAMRAIFNSRYRLRVVPDPIECQALPVLLSGRDLYLIAAPPKSGGAGLFSGSPSVEEGEFSAYAFSILFICTSILSRLKSDVSVSTGSKVLSRELQRLSLRR